MKQKENINSILYFSSPDALATKSNLLKEPFTIILVASWFSSSRENLTVYLCRIFCEVQLNVRD